MKILIIGSGGREHSLGYYLSQDSRVEKLYFAPGNGGTENIGDNVPIQITDLVGLLDFAKKINPDLTVVGPEAPLCLGVVDLFEKNGFKIFGPRAEAAQIEGSKIFSKELLLEADVPTSSSHFFENSSDAFDYLETASFPVVIKAEGLAAGKGVVIAQNEKEAMRIVRQMLDEKILGAAATRILIEEFLEGEELSVLAVTDGSSYQLLPAAQDHKRLLDNDEGPNTGGVGAYAPSILGTNEALQTICHTVFDPIFALLKKKGIEYRGVLYAGLMMTQQGPKVIEFNARFGDPETQVILPLLETPLLDILLAVVERKLEKLTIHFKPAHAFTVVLTSAGYPQKPETGKLIKGCEEIHHENKEESILFHAGTRLKEGLLYTSGGRVLCATGVGQTLSNAAQIAYELAEKIQFDGKHFRRDIGKKALQASYHSFSPLTHAFSGKASTAIL